MENLLTLLAAPSPQELQRKAEGFFGLAKDYAFTYWYFTIPAVFVGVFVLFLAIARWKMR